MSLRAGWGSIVKCAKNLNATPGFLFCKSILSLCCLWLACLSIPCLSPNAPLVAWHLGLILRISLVILICGIASHCSRRICRRSCRLDATHIALSSWFHNYSIWFRSGCPLCPRYLPGLQLISDDPGSMRVNIKSRQMCLNQTMKLWNLGGQVSVECMSFILCMEMWLLHYTELTQMNVAFDTFHYRPHTVLGLIAGPTIIRKSHLFSRSEVEEQFSP